VCGAGRNHAAWRGGLFHGVGFGLVEAFSPASVAVRPGLKPRTAALLEGPQHFSSQVIRKTVEKQ
jgi:hypothetical protein